MPLSGLSFRGLEEPSEIDAFFRLALRSLVPETPTDELPQRAAGWRDWVIRDPRYVPGQLRGAFLGERLVGGCIVYERWLPFGPARLRTGCVGGVAVEADSRHLGIGSALMDDVLAYARARGQTLLLLDGIPGFYRRLGYMDMLDYVEHAVECAAILTAPESPYHIRTAKPDDAQALLGLYHRHFGPYLGRFERSLEQQQRNIESHPPFNPIYLAVDEKGQPRGYLLFDWEHRGAHAAEVAADDWPATLALLQHHAREVTKLPEPASEVHWPLPPDSPALFAIADRMPVRSETRIRPDDGWMARPASLPALFQALLPLWRERWQRVAPPWIGVLALEVGDEREGAACALEFGQGSLRMVEYDPTNPHQTHFSQQAFVQLLFGYRSLAWLAEQPGQSLPKELWPALEVLFPPVRAWIPGTDAF